MGGDHVTGQSRAIVSLTDNAVSELDRTIDQNWIEHTAEHQDTYYNLYQVVSHEPSGAFDKILLKEYPRPTSKE